MIGPVDDHLKLVGTPQPPEPPSAEPPEPPPASTRAPELEPAPDDEPEPAPPLEPALALEPELGPAPELPPEPWPEPAVLPALAAPAPLLPALLPRPLKLPALPLDAGEPPSEAHPQRANGAMASTAQTGEPVPRIVFPFELGAAECGRTHRSNGRPRPGSSSDAPLFRRGMSASRLGWKFVLAPLFTSNAVPNERSRDLPYLPLSTSLKGTHVVPSKRTSCSCSNGK